MYSETFDDIYTINIGRNQAENDKLISSVPQTSLWFHLRDGSSPHGFLYSENGEKPTKQAITRVALLVKQYSKAKSLRRVAVEYCSIKNVKKTDVPGRVVLSSSPKIINI